MLRERNMLHAAEPAADARLTMFFEMATLYSGLPGRRRRAVLAFRRFAAEGATRAKTMFCDVSRQLCGMTVAKRRQWGAGLIAATLLSACATGGGVAADAPADVKRAAVADRAKARWDRLIAGDLAGAYEYLSPASRATLSLDSYRAKHKVGMYRSVKIDDVKCEGEACTVKLSLTYDFKRHKGVTTPLTENWIISQGQAWFVDRG
jgi:hypothetical protein